MTEEAISIRGLTDGGDIPVTKFKGTLAEIVPDTNQYGTYASLNFQIIDVLASDSPYELPIAPIRIKVSNRKKSKWGIFSQSLARFLPDDEDVKDCIGKEMVLEKTDGHMLYSRDANEGAGGDIPMKAWEVVEFEGGVAEGEGSGGTAKDKAMELLDGATISEFNKAALADSKIRKDADLVKAITNRSFITGMLEAGIFSKDVNDVYHKL